MSRRLIAHLDWILLITVLLICLMGEMNLYSIPGSYLTGRYMKQIYWLSGGMVLVIVLTLIDYRIFERLAYPFYGICCLLLVLVRLIGPKINGSHRWFIVGGVSFQPSEMMKIGLVLALAKYFHDLKVREGYSFKHLLIPFALVLLPVFLILIEPDLGTSLVMLFIAAVMILFVKVRLRVILILLMITAVALPVAWNFLSPYQISRIKSLFNPEVDKKRKGWQSNQAVIAIGSGRLTGKGFRKGTQTQLSYVPEQHNDFAFCGWAEEWGFLGSAFLLFLFYLLIFRALVISSRAKERFGALLALGLGVVIFWHVVINVGMVTRLLPVVGITLPFYSYGGSAILTMMFAVGLLMSISIRRFQY